MAFSKHYAKKKNHKTKPDKSGHRKATVSIFNNLEKIISIYTSRNIYT